MSTIVRMRRKFRKELGRALRDQRIRQGMSQEALAAACGIHRTYVSILERGLKSPTVEVLSAIAEALEIRPSRLLITAENAAGENRP